jgi:hypothetical protein
MNVSSVLAASAVVSIAPVTVPAVVGAFLLLMSLIIDACYLVFNMRAKII